MILLLSLAKASGKAERPFQVKHI